MHDLGFDFWGPLFGFLTTCVTSVRWLIRVWYLNKQRTNIHQANLEMTIEKFKSTEAGKFVLSMQGAIDNLKLVVASHGELFNKVTQAINAIQLTEKHMTDMMYKLENQYGNFEQRMTSVTQGGQVISKRLDTIESEIVTMNPKSGNVFVRNKK